MSNNGVRGRVLLESLQQNAMLDNGPPSRDPDTASVQLLGKQPGLTEHWEPTQRALPTPFQNTADFALLGVLLDRLEATAKSVGFPAPSHTTFGTLGLGWFGAETLRIPDSDESVVVFQVGTFTLIELLAKCIAHALPATVGPDRTSLDVRWEAIACHLEVNEEPAQRLAEGLAAYAIHGDPLYARRYSLDAVHALPIRALVLSADMFVLGHEYAHVLLHRPDPGFPASETDGSAQAIERRHQLEFEADALGLRISTSAMCYTAGFDAALSYWGITLLLTSLDLVERAISTVASGQARLRCASRTHPPLTERRTMADAALRQLMGEQAAKDPLEVAATIERIVETLWKQIEGRMCALHQAGMPLSSIWLKRGFKPNDRPNP